MRSGRKTNKVDVRRGVQTVDPDTNAPIYTEGVWKSAWAIVTTRKATETAVSEQVVGRQFTRFEFDYLDVVGVVETDVIRLDDGTDFGIIGVLPDYEQKRYILVDAVARRPGSERT